MNRAEYQNLIDLLLRMDRNLDLIQKNTAPVELTTKFISDPGDELMAMAADLNTVIHKVTALEKTTKSVTMNQADFEQHRGRAEERLTALEQIAGFGPRAGDGFREIPAGERGEEEE